MYFVICSITSQVLWYVYLAVFAHVALKAIMSIGKDEEFEFPFYLKRLYPLVVKFFNTIKDSYQSEFKDEDIKTRWLFMLFLFAFVLVSWMINHLIPIISIVVIGYLIINYRLEYGGKEKGTSTSENS